VSSYEFLGAENHLLRAADKRRSSLIASSDSRGKVMGSPLILLEGNPLRLNNMLTLALPFAKGEQGDI